VPGRARVVDAQPSQARASGSAGRATCVILVAYSGWPQWVGPRWTNNVACLVDMAVELCAARSSIDELFLQVG